MRMIFGSRKSRPKTDGGLRTIWRCIIYHYILKEDCNFCCCRMDNPGKEQDPLGLKTEIT